MKEFAGRDKLKRKRKCRGKPWSVFLFVTLAWGVRALAQTNTATGSPVLTPLTPVAPYASPTNSAAANATNSVSSGGATNVANLGAVTVVGQLNQARSQILTSVGATAYTHSAANIQAQSQGANAPMNQVILRSPGVAEDSAVNGGLHVRGEHANLQYRINDVLLPETLVGTFGLVLSPRFVQSMQLIDGSLPAEYGFRTAGIIDIQTKTGAFANGGEADLYGGSFNTFNPSFEYGETDGPWDIFVEGSFNQNDLGIENPTNTVNAVHDQTDQYKAFGYASRLLSDTSRITLMSGASYSTYQIPNPTYLTPGAPTGATTNYAQAMTSHGLNPNTDPLDLNETQVERDYFLTAAFQQSLGDLNYQLSAFGQISGVHFFPDPNGDLVFDGEASDVARNLYSDGAELDASDEIGDKHTLRFGGIITDEYLTDDNSTTVFTLDPFNNPNGLETVVQNFDANAIFAGAYVQDEWKILPKVTINYGVRFDEYHSTYINENQPGPRINIVYKPTDWTTLHAGYSRFFTPPPLENVPAGNLGAFDGTSGASGVPLNDTVKAERANYYDAGISQKITQHLQLGVDGYYKTARDQLDDGNFNQTLILSSFNYAKGRVEGVEFTGNYNLGGFSTYANVSLEKAQGSGAESAQFIWPDQATLNYVNSHWIYLDHDQLLSVNCGASYLWRQTDTKSALFYVDSIFGSGLRQAGGGTIPGGDPIPNGASVPNYYNINMGVEEDFKIHHDRILKARFDVVNVTDNSYELRSGSGVGVFAPQYGMRRGFFGSVGLAF
ncbi:MAG TPA: TonB-dependent receptor [Verrucomicrobiae bacterium]|nr:TonB-dependent receptor [Verrucomicrobiae bacterium]